MDTAEYLRLRLRRAGCDRDLFDSDALALLHQATQGAMRDLDRLATHALRLAAAKKRRLIDRAILSPKPSPSTPKTPPSSHSQPTSPAMASTHLRLPLHVTDGHQPPCRDAQHAACAATPGYSGKLHLDALTQRRLRENSLVVAISSTESSVG